MRELTFAGFLKNDVRRLSLAGTNGLYKLAAEAAKENPRLQAPLLLYALFTDKTEILLRAAKSPALRRDYEKMLARFDKAAMEQALTAESPALPESYRKVWRSYKSQRNRRQNDDHSKALMRSRIVKLQREKAVSNYRLYTDLKLNPGNFNAWLKHGDNSKVGLDTARKTLRYLEDHKKAAPPRLGASPGNAPRQRP